MATEPVTDVYDITNLTKHCILHGCLSLSPVGIRLPASGTFRIEQFCQDILGFILSYKNAKRKKKDLLPETTLVPQIEILKFYERAITARDFASILSDHISEMVGPDFNETDIHRLCWDLYFEHRKADLSYPKWLTIESTFCLWQVFCSLLSSMADTIDCDIMNDVLMRVLKLGGYTWNESFECRERTSIDFPTFLEVLAESFSDLKLDSCLVGEVVTDLRDEIVFGVLRKGYLIKKGHRVQNLKRRWFVLTRNELIYYKSRDDLREKGRLVISNDTKTESLSEKGDRKHKFIVTCGKTGKQYEISADDNRTRNEWLLDIGKAIQLEQALQQANQEDFSSSLANFYQLKYGTTSPNLKRIDSTVRHATISSSPSTQVRIQKISIDDGIHSLNFTATDNSLSKSKQDWNPGVYEDMDIGIGEVPGEKEEKVDDDDGYIFMFQGENTDVKKALENATSGSDSSPDSVTMTGDREHLNEKKKDRPGLYEECDLSPRYVPTKHENTSKPPDPDSDEFFHSTSSSHFENVSDLQEFLHSTRSGSDLENVSHLMKVPLRKSPPPIDNKQDLYLTLVHNDQSPSPPSSNRNSGHSNTAKTHDHDPGTPPIPPPRSIESLQSSPTSESVSQNPKSPTTVPQRTVYPIYTDLYAPPIPPRSVESINEAPTSPPIPRRGHDPLTPPICPPRPIETLNEDMSISLIIPQHSQNHKPPLAHSESIGFDVSNTAIDKDVNGRSSQTPPPSIPQRDDQMKPLLKMKTTNDLYKKAPLSSHSPTIHNTIRTDNDYNCTNTITESSDAYYVIPLGPSHQSKKSNY